MSGVIEIQVPSKLRDVERRLLVATMEHCGWNVRKAASELGVSWKTVYLWLKRFDLSRPR